MSAELVVLSQERSLLDVIAAAPQRWVVAGNGDELVACASTARVVIVDRDHPAASDAVAQVAALRRPRALSVLVVRDPSAAPRGADAVVLTGSFPAFLTELAGAGPSESAAFERAIAVSLLSGPLEAAIAHASKQLAACFAVDRCLLVARAAAGVGHDAVPGNYDPTPDRCRGAAALDATVIADVGDEVCSCLATWLATPDGSEGWIGLVAGGVRVFTATERRALGAIAARLGSELHWRAAHDRTTNDLDRFVSGPGLDPLLGIWNRNATTQFGTMYVSAARRTKLPFSVVVLELVDLHGINARHGMAIGDHALRRMADALRTMARTDDLIGRWSASKMVAALVGTGLEGARRFGERALEALAARPIELPAGQVFPITVKIGMSALQASTDLATLVDAAVAAAEGAAEGGMASATSPDRGPRNSGQFDAVNPDLESTLGGTYRLIHEISRGGMGVVYRAEDLALERPVAIKMLRPDFAEDSAFVERLRSEAALLARLHHPNLVQIFNFGQSGGDSYFVMELVEGEALQHAAERHRTENTTTPISEIVAVIEQIASALDALHERGVVHRDVKPANVILDPFRGRSVLVDVGIARRYGDQNQFAGTPGFVAPEVIAGEEATARSDVYGLAATAYTLLTLETPWGDGQPVAVLTRQCTEPPKRPSALRAELAPADDILLRALAPRPTNRPESAGAFARALVQALAAAAAPPPPVSARRNGDTILPGRSARSLAKTRGLVFRSVTRAVGMRDSTRLRDAIAETHTELSRVLADAAPMSWQPTTLLSELFVVAPPHVSRDGTRFARDVARATVRATFRRFFPASAATLSPESTLSAIRNIWSRYQSWGKISCMPVSNSESVIRLSATPVDPMMCEWTHGLLEQLVGLSGGQAPEIEHAACETRGDEACVFRVRWER